MRNPRVGVWAPRVGAISSLGIAHQTGPLTLSLVRATSSELQPVVVNDLALNATLYYATDLSYTALDISLSSALYGILTFLVILALAFLSRKGLGHTPVRILLPSIVLLYGSTTLYMAALASHITSVNQLVAKAQAGLFSDAYINAEVEVFESGVLKQSWMMTVALTINVLIGDSIVWWRVCAVWRNRIVYFLGPFLILFTCGFGLKALLGVHHCARSCEQPQMLLPAGVFADACASLSLAVNFLATSLIGYKTWTHWRLLREHPGSGRPNSRVMNALAMLIESGTVSCILLIIVVVYEASPALFATPDVHQNTFLRVVADYTYAYFVHVIAIYPVLIIVIVALDWSPIDHLTGVTTIDDGNVHSSTHLNFRVTTSMTAASDTMPTRCSRDEDGALQAETNQAQSCVRLGA